MIYSTHWLHRKRGYKDTHGRAHECTENVMSILTHIYGWAFDLCKQGPGCMPWSTSKYLQPFYLGLHATRVEGGDANVFKEIFIKTPPKKSERYFGGFSVVGAVAPF